MATGLASFLQAADLSAYQPQLEELGVVAPVDIDRILLPVHDDDRAD